MSQAKRKRSRLRCRQGVPGVWCGVIAALALAVGYLLGDGLAAVRVVELRDTVVHVRHVPEVRYVVKARRVVKRDTVVLPMFPFVAEHDTVIAKDTVSVSFSYPEFSFGVWLRKAPDSVVVVYQRDVVPVQQRGRSWWKEAAEKLGLVFGGFVLGRVAR